MINIIPLISLGCSDKEWPFGFFNVLLVLLLALAVAMPFLTGKPGADTPFEWVSLQGLSMIVIGLTFIVIVRLFINISRYYDPNDLYETIDRYIRPVAIYTDTL